MMKLPISKGKKKKLWHLLKISLFRLLHALHSCLMSHQDLEIGESNLTLKCVIVSMEHRDFLLAKRKSPSGGGGSSGYKRQKKEIGPPPDFYKDKKFGRGGARVKIEGVRPKDILFIPSTIKNWKNNSILSDLCLPLSFTVAVLNNRAWENDSVENLEIRRHLNMMNSKKHPREQEKALTYIL